MYELERSIASFRDGAAARTPGDCPADCDRPSPSRGGELSMDEARKDDFVGRHLIVDGSTYNRRNLTSTDTVFALFELSAARISGRRTRSGSC
jgi:hypothetical protein